jgi:Ras-related protein Rab-32
MAFGMEDEKESEYGSEPNKGGLIGANKVFYRHALGAIIVTDVTKENSIKNAIQWKNQIDEIVWLKNNKPLPKLIIANKYDKISHLEERGTGLDSFMT